MNYLANSCIELDEDGRIYVPENTPDAVRTLETRAGEDPSREALVDMPERAERFAIQN